MFRVQFFFVRMGSLCRGFPLRSIGIQKQKISPLFVLSIDYFTRNSYKTFIIVVTHKRLCDALTQTKYLGDDQTQTNDSR